MYSDKSIAYEQYKYIHSPPYAHNSSDVLENKYKDNNSIFSRFTVYIKEVGYRVYNSINDFISHLYSLDVKDRVFNEVIFDGHQKLKFDIDIKADDMTDIIIEDTADVDIVTTLLTYVDNDSKYKSIFTSILFAIRNAFLVLYGFELAREHEVICESKCPQNKKFSNHIIIDNYYVSNSDQAVQFTLKVLSYLPEQYRRFLDTGVNKRIQCFRIANCHKIDDTRIKCITSEHDLPDSFITNVSNCTKLADIAVKSNTERVYNHLESTEVDQILAICEKNDLMNDHRYKYVLDGMFVFARIRPSYCEFCNRTHEYDNSLIVSTRNVCGYIYIYKHCIKNIQESKTNPTIIRQPPIKIGRIISHILISDDSADIDTHSWADNIIRSILERPTYTPLYSTTLLFDNMSKTMKNIYSAAQLQPFELVSNLIVHAAMKMGKTKGLVEHINKHFNSKLRPSVIRFISFRQTFSNNLKEKFNDFVLYNEIKGPISDKKLIIQVESLYRLDIHPGAEPPDLIILDECESIFEQFDSGLLRGNFNECFAKFQYLIKYSKYIICMDAVMSNRTYRILKQMRPGFECEGNTIYHHNTYKNARDDTYYISSDKLKWLGILYSSIDADEKVAIPISSLSEAKIIYNNLVKKYPNKQFKLYSSESSISEKRKHFSDVNSYWSQYDGLLYTPTVSAGVSFEEKHFDKIFCYFTDRSCSAEICTQMIGRIRNLSTRKLFVCIAATGNSLPTTIDEIRSMLFTGRENLLNDFDNTGLRIEYNRSGEMIYHTNDYFHVWLENISIRNISKNAFIKRFIHLVSLSGAGLKYLSDDIFEQYTGTPILINGKRSSELVDINLMHLNTKTEIHEEHCKNIAAAVELTNECVEEIQSKMIAQLDITDQQRYAYEKYKLRKDYQYSGPISDKFVSKYNNVRVRRMYKNIVRIHPYTTIDDALNNIQLEERAYHKYIMSLGVNEQYHDLTRKYVFDQHRYALSLLRLCGWTGINDPQYIHKIILLQHLDTNKDLYWNNISAACGIFEVKPPDIVVANQLSDDTIYIAYILKPINKILNAMYGISITWKKNDPGMFLLNHNSLFTASSAVSKSKNIPLIAIDQFI